MDSHVNRHQKYALYPEMSTIFSKMSASNACMLATFFMSGADKVFQVVMRGKTGLPPNPPLCYKLLFNVTFITYSD